MGDLETWKFVESVIGYFFFCFVAKCLAIVLILFGCGGCCCYLLWAFRYSSSKNFTNYNEKLWWFLLCPMMSKAPKLCLGLPKHVRIGQSRRVLGAFGNIGEKRNHQIFCGSKMCLGLVVVRSIRDILGWPGALGSDSQGQRQPLTAIVIVESFAIHWILDINKKNVSCKICCKLFLVQLYYNGWWN